MDEMLEFGFIREGPKSRTRPQNKEDQAQAGALFIPWVELSKPGCSVAKRPTSLGQADRILRKKLGQIDRKAQRRAQLKEHDPDPKAAQADRDKGGSTEDKLTSTKGKIR